MTPAERAAFRVQTAGDRRQALASAPPAVRPETARTLCFWWHKKDQPQQQEAASGAA